MGHLRSPMLASPSLYDARASPILASPSCYDARVPPLLTSPSCYDARVPTALSSPSLYDASLLSALSSPSLYDAIPPTATPSSVSRASPRFSSSRLSDDARLPSFLPSSTSSSLPSSTFSSFLPSSLPSSPSASPILPSSTPSSMSSSPSASPSARPLVFTLPPSACQLSFTSRPPTSSLSHSSMLSTPSRSRKDSHLSSSTVSLLRLRRASSIVRPTSVPLPASSKAAALIPSQTPGNRCAKRGTRTRSLLSLRTCPTIISRICRPSPEERCTTPLYSDAFSPDHPRAQC